MKHNIAMHWKDICGSLWLYPTFNIRQRTDGKCSVASTVCVIWMSSWNPLKLEVVLHILRNMAKFLVNDLCCQYMHARRLPVGKSIERNLVWFNAHNLRASKGPKTTTATSCRSFEKVGMILRPWNFLHFHPVVLWNEFFGSRAESDMELEVTYVYWYLSSSIFGSPGKMFFQYLWTFGVSRSSSTAYSRRVLVRTRSRRPLSGSLVNIVFAINCSDVAAPDPCNSHREF